MSTHKQPEKKQQQQQTILNGVWPNLVNPLGGVEKKTDKSFKFLSATHKHKHALALFMALNFNVTNQKQKNSNPTSKRI